MYVQIRLKSTWFNQSQLTLLSVGVGGNTARSFGLNLRLFTLVFLNLGKKRSQDSLASDGSFMSSFFIIKIYGHHYAKQW